MFRLQILKSMMEVMMGLFSKKKAEPVDFSDVRGGSSTTARSPMELTPTTPMRTYTVVSGDSLSKIAKREYGDASRWNAIYEANRDKIKDPDLIHPGQVLTIPTMP